MPKILIVEDNAESRESLAARLQCRGFAVVMAGDGKAGVAMVAAEKPDLVLMDMIMPEMDGWEATRQIKASIGCEAVPIIALTEHSMPDDRDRALGVGCAGSYDKPIEFAELFAQIEELLQSRALPETPLLAQGECVLECP
jgi:two-component system cell cycle response regulator DivK